MSFRSSLILGFVAGLLFLTSTQTANAVIRDGGIDPSNLGKGEWIYSMKDATNKLGGHIASVTSEATLFQYYKSIGIRYILIKAGTGSTNYGGCYASPSQITQNLCNIARTNNVWVIPYTRSYGSDLPGESALADACFHAGADGFMFDAEAEWETRASNTWITNGPAQAWQLCSMVRSNWPNKFIAHAPFPIISLHSTFPYKEFGYWCDAIMPQIYHFSSSGLQGSPSAAINWSDVNWRSWQNSLYSLPSTNINGITVNWTNSIKPITPLEDVYGPTISGGLLCNGGAGAQPDLDVMEFIDYSAADPNCVTAGGYRGINFWRADLHGAQQFAYIKAGTCGNIAGVVNNIVIDDADATAVGGWTAVKVFDATPSAPSYYGDPAVGGTDNAPFGTNYYKITKGTGSSYMEFKPNVLTAGDYNVYQWHANRSDASVAVPATIGYDNGTNAVNVNQTTNSGTWSFIGKFPFAAGTNGFVRFSDGFPETSGVAMVDGLKMVFVPPVAIPTVPTGLSATAFSSSQINLSWNDTSTNETGFVIFRGTVSGGPYSSIATVGRNITTFGDTNLSAGVTYYYVVRSTNYLGASANSNQASPLVAPIITLQPQSITVAQGGTANFTVGVFGTTPLSYQWKKDGNTLVNGGNISGATSTNLTLLNLAQTDAGNYSITITNTVGATNSIPASLTVATVPPGVVTQPANKTVNAGATATFTVVANGTLPLSFQWKKNGTPLVNGGKISGATSLTLSITNCLKIDEGGYSVTITNLYGTTNSVAAALTVNDPAIVLNPVDQIVDAGATVVFTASANGTPTLSYQWKKNGTNLVNNAKISGATTTSLTITNVLQADSADYTMLVSNSFSNAISLPAYLGVQDPVIASKPVSRTNIAGTTATFTVVVNGTAPIAYKWKKGPNFLSNGGNISGATNGTLTIASVSQADATSYSVVVNNPIGTVTSASAGLVVIDPPAITTQPQGRAVIRGSNVVFTVVATGTQPLSYQWLWNGTNIVGASQTSYTLPDVQTNSAGDYSVQISNAGGTLISSNANLVVNVPFEIFNLLPVVRANSVIVNWATTSNSTSQVEYGLTTNLGYLSPFIGTPVTNHSILLTSLKPDATYYFKVTSQVGLVSISSNTTFFTDSSIIVDNANATYQGFWTLSTGSTDKYGAYYQFSSATNTALTAYAQYVPTIVIPGKYDVYTWYGTGSSRSTNTTMVVSGIGGSITSRVDQSTGGGSWRLLTSGKDLAAGTSAYARVANDTGETNRVVVADAFLWKYSVSQDVRTNGTVPDWWANYYFGTTNISAQADADGDSYSSFAEYVLGTIPNDSSSKLDFRIQRTGSNVVQAIFSPCAAGRNYDLQLTTNLVNWFSTQSPLVLSNGQGVITATNSGGQPAFFRLSVTLAP